MEKRARDSQRKAVYDWEHAVIRELCLPEVRMSLEECTALVRRVWEDYRPGDRVPEVRDGRGRRSAFGSRSRIGLPCWSRTSIVVLHEIAHSLQTDRPAHSRQFATLMLELWRRYANVDHVKARKLGINPPLLANGKKPRRVRFAPVANCPQPVGREQRAWRQEEQRLMAALTEARRLLVEHQLKKPLPTAVRRQAA